VNRFIVARYPALGSPTYRRFWLASFASVGATQLITLGQGWLVYQLSGSAIVLGLLGASAAVPNILMTLLGGVIADRFEKRRIMMITSGITALLLALLAWLDFTGAVAVWHVLSIAAAVSLISGLDWPARVSFFPLLVERQAFMSAVALNSFIWQATRMAIPALGGLLIAAAGATWIVFVLGAMGFSVMCITVASIRVGTPPTVTQSAIEQLKEGLNFIWRASLFRYLIGLTFIGMFFSQSYVQIMPVFADLLGSDEKGFGYLLSAGGVGSVIGTLLIGSVHRFRRLGMLMLGGAALSVLMLDAFALCARAGWFPPAIGFALVTAACASVFMITSMTVLQLGVPDALRGRVMGIHTIGYSLMPLGGLFIGGLAEELGADMAVFTGSGIYLVAVALLWLKVPLVRSLDGRSLEGSDASERRN